MSIGIEQFRNLTTKTDLENRRITVDRDTQEITAPKSLWGRLVNWVRGTGVRQDRAELNQHARSAFYNALVKSSNPEFAEKVIKRVYGEQITGQTFSERTTNLQVSKVKQILDTARDMRRELRMDNERELERFISNGNLGSVTETMARGKFSSLGHPQLKKDDPDVRREFRNLVRLDPNYRHHSFTRDELDALAARAVERACEVKKARFDEQYPHLAKIDSKHFHDPETFFTQLGGELDELWMGDALSSIKDSTELLGKMSFDRTGASGLRNDTVGLRDQLKAMRDDPPEMRYPTAHDDLVRRLALDALENFPVQGNFQNHLQQLVTNFVNQALSDLSQDQSIEDPEVRRQVVDDVCKALDEELISLLADPELLNSVRKLESDGRKISNSNAFDREDQLQRINEDITKLSDQIINSTKDQRLQIIQNYREKFEAGLSNDPEMETLPQLRKLDDLQCRLERECDNQIAKLDSKIEYLTSYLNQDPRSEASFLYDKLIWAKATVSSLERSHDRIATEKQELNELFQAQQNGDLLSEDQVRRLQDYDGKVLTFNKQLEFLDGRINLAQARVTDCEEDLLRAQRFPDGDNDMQLIEEVDGGGDEPEEFDPKAQRARLKQNRNDEVEYFRSLVSESANLSLSRAGLVLDQARERVLSNPESITPTRRDMVVTRDGVTRTYRSENIPGGGKLLEGEWSLIENWAKEQGYPESAFRVPNLQVSQLKQVVSKTDDDDVTQEEVLKSQIIRHGVIEGFDIENPDLRERVGTMQARQVLTLGVNLAPREFLVEARRRHGDGEERSKFIHVNIALSTSDPSGRHLDRRDGELIQHQIDQFDQFRGEKLLMVRFNGEEIEQPEDFGDGVVQIVSDNTLVDFDIDPITFSFTVSGKGTGTRFDEHDKQNMIKLVGDLAVGTAPGGYIGGVVDALQAKRDHPETSDTERQQIDDMLGKIRREVDTARELFTTGAYKDVSVDPYKMARTVMRVVDLAGEGLRLSGDRSMHMSMSEGCRTNLEGGGKLDIEHKSQVIIEDMGGRVQPMQLDRGGGSLNDQDRIIYNTVLTSSGDTEVRQQRTGLSGLGDVRDIGTRSRDIEALSYTSGLTDPNRR